MTETNSPPGLWNPPVGICVLGEVILFQEASVRCLHSPQSGPTCRCGQHVGTFGHRSEH
jgi:hypothetical protein